MELGDWRTISGPGVFPMAVKGAHNWGPNTDEDVLLWERPSLFGTRIRNDKVGDGRLEEGDTGLGHYIEDPFWRGDIIGGTHWQRNTRDIGAWRWSWPTVIGEYIPPPVQLSSPTGSMTGFNPLIGGGFSLTQVNLPTGSAVAAGGSYAHYLNPIKRVNPYSGEWDNDSRFASITARMPKDESAQDIWPWFPKGFHGIMLGADWEDDQHELFHPTDPRTIAAHVEERKEFGSLMCDLKPGDEIDNERTARYQSMFWVIKEPNNKYVNFHGENTIAWSIGGSGLGDVRGGLMIDKDSRYLGGGKGFGTPSGGGKTNLNPEGSYDLVNYTTTGGGGGKGQGGPLGHISQRQSGPIEIPCTKSGPSSHWQGTDADGNDIYSSHLSMNSYFTFPHGIMDGPLKHDGYYVRPDSPPETAYVFFQYDAGFPHPFIGGQRYGKHRWWAQTNKYSPPCSPPGNPTVGGAPGPGQAGEWGPGAAFLDAPTISQPSPQGALSNTYMAEWTKSLLGGDAPFYIAGSTPPIFGQQSDPPWWEEWWESWNDTLMEVGEEVEEWRNKIPGAKTLGDSVEDFWKKVGKKFKKTVEKTKDKAEDIGKKKFGNFPTADEIWQGYKDVVTGKEPVLPGKDKNNPITWSVFDLYKYLWEQAKKLGEKVGLGPVEEEVPPTPPYNGPSAEDPWSGGGGATGEWDVPNPGGPGPGPGSGPLNPGGGNPWRRRVKVPKKKTPEKTPPQKKKNPGGGGGGGGGGAGCGGSNEFAQKVAPYSPSDSRGFLPYQYSSMEEGGISYIWRPQRFQDREIDWRKWTKPNRSYRLYTTDSFSPITARFEAFGAQGDRHDSSDTVLGLSTDWKYTHKPNSYRYMSGTANGGVCLLPPEIDLADIDNNLDPLSDTIAKSKSFFVAGRGTAFGAGIPDLFLGGMEEGYSWSDDGSGGLTFSTNVESTATTRVQFSVNGSVGIGGDSYGGALGSVVFIANASRAPLSNPTGGGILYVTGGALTYRGSSGTVTTLASA